MLLILTTVRVGRIARGPYSTSPFFQIHWICFGVWLSKVSFEGATKKRDPRLTDFDTALGQNFTVVGRSWVDNTISEWVSVRVLQRTNSTGKNVTTQTESIAG